MKTASTLLQINKNRRSRIEIISDVITLIQNEESKFTIREKAHLSSQQARLYLEELTRLELIEMKYVKGKKVYMATRLGNQFLEQYHTLRKFLS